MTSGFDYNVGVFMTSEEIKKKEALREKKIKAFDILINKNVDIPKLLHWISGVKDSKTCLFYYHEDIKHTKTLYQPQELTVEELDLIKEVL